MGTIQKLLEKYHLQKWFQRDNLLILVLAGILLVVITFPTKEEPKESSGINRATTVATKEVSDAERKETEGGRYEEWNEYAEYLEEKLEGVLANMRGVGGVKVMITLETSEEQVVEKDEPIQRDNTTETDKNGGNRVIYKLDSGQETVYSKQGDTETPYISKVILPKVSGVLIVAEGAGQGTNTKNITEIAMALFGVEAHKVKVVAMEE